MTASFKPSSVNTRCERQNNPIPAPISASWLAASYTSIRMSSALDRAYASVSPPTPPPLELRELQGTLDAEYTHTIATRSLGSECDSKAEDIAIGCGIVCERRGRENEEEMRDVHLDRADLSCWRVLRLEGDIILISR